MVIKVPPHRPTDASQAGAGKRWRDHETSSVSSPYCREVSNDHLKHRAANGTIGYMLGSTWSKVWLATPPQPQWPTVIPEDLSVSSHLNNFFQLCDNSLLIEDPEGNMVRSLHFTHLSQIYHTFGEVRRGRFQVAPSPDTHPVGPQPPCLTLDVDVETFPVTFV